MTTPLHNCEPDNGWYWEVPTIRWLPGHVWIRLFIGPGVQRGHGWMYRGIIRRDAWRLGSVGFGILRMPKARPS